MLRLRAIALALRVLRLRASLDVSRFRAHASRALALRVLRLRAIALALREAKKGLSFLCLLWLISSFGKGNQWEFE
jgi:hypothetical protein